ERNPDGTTTVHSMAFDHNGHIDPKHPPEERVVGEPDSGPRGQPREDGSSGRPDNCNWNPILGRCTKQRVSVRHMTSQPSRGDEGTATTNSSARPRLGSEAVTNPGDAGYSVDRGGRRGTGKPYDPRDPADAFGQGVPKPPPEKH
ncbi:MAG: hypothetical protein KDI09_15280, partial [Halioglobus sp.]|nr:hypothetical protein [Halioglobus sp.]